MDKNKMRSPSKEEWRKIFKLRSKEKNQNLTIIDFYKIVTKMSRKNNFSITRETVRKKINSFGLFPFNQKKETRGKNKKAVSLDQEDKKSLESYFIELIEDFLEKSKTNSKWKAKAGKKLKSLFNQLSKPEAEAEAETIQDKNTISSLLSIFKGVLDSDQKEVKNFVSILDLKDKIENIITPLENDKAIKETIDKLLELEDNNEI